MGPQTAKHDVQISPEVVSILKSLGRNAIFEFYTDIASRHSHTLDLRNFFLVWQQGETVQRKKTEERAKRHLVPTNGYKWRAAFSNKHQFSNYPPQIIIIMKVVSVLLKAYFHTVRNLHFLSKNSTLISRENCRFFWVKNSWKCCGFGLFSCWQLWFHEKNCQTILGEKLVKRLGFCQNWIFGQKFDF